MLGFENGGGGGDARNKGRRLEDGFGGRDDGLVIFFFEVMIVWVRWCAEQTVAYEPESHEESDVDGGQTCRYAAVGKGFGG